MKKKEQSGAGLATQLRESAPGAFGLTGAAALGGSEAEIYRAMRENVPILDAAIGKLVRLTGGFTVTCGDRAAEKGLRQFLKTVPVGHAQYGLECFLQTYLDCMLTYGRAVGEMIVADGRLAAVCWGDVTKIHVRQGASALEMELCVCENGALRALPYQNLLLFSTWKPEPGNPYGVSLLRGMPFLTEILMKIYRTVGVNWERAGNVRYSVVYKPDDASGQIDAQERSEQIAEQWSQAMQESRHGVVRDFVAVGDVQIKVIGADGQILDSEVPVRQILEQLVAKTGLPPFLLGLNWASTERMSAQQTDLLTSELWAIRRTVEPVLLRICRLWMQLHGYVEEPEIVWDEISLQDIVEQAHAALYRAQAEKLTAEQEETT